MSLAPPSSSSPSSSAPSFKKRKRSTTNGGWTSTTTKTSDGPDLSSRKERFTAMDQSRFWELRSGRTVEEALYNASLKQKANFKMRSYAIDFGCERTKALFTKDEWKEMKELDDFQLPRLLESTEREAWPAMKGLLSDMDGLTMIDGEKAGLESGKRRNMGRKVDMETPTPRKQTGQKLDLVARDTTNKRDWFVVESLKEWDEVSTKFLHELDVTLFKDLHLIASHRLQEQPSPHFRSQARFFAIYSGGKPLSTTGLSKRL
ncbi:hypothetical protein BGZ58_003045 [Dissophora ornata]|nr:hypothetical protein BGZ58_003045 [Dissophora ornata]